MKSVLVPGVIAIAALMGLTACHPTPPPAPPPAPPMMAPPPAPPPEPMVAPPPAPPPERRVSRANRRCGPNKHWEAKHKAENGKWVRARCVPNT